MKMNKKGFTLIELLAVIVILAIVALVATPIIMTTVGNAKKSAAIASANNVITAINNNQQMVDFEEGGILGTYSDATVKKDDYVNGSTTKESADAPDRISTASLQRALTNTDFKISGDKPTVVDLNVSGNIISNGCMVISGYTVHIDGGKAVSDGTVKADANATKCTCSTSNGTTTCNN